MYCISTIIGYYCTHLTVLCICSQNTEHYWDMISITFKQIIAPLAIKEHTLIKVY